MIYPLRIELQQMNQCNQVSEVGFKTCANSERIQNMLVFTAIRCTHITWLTSKTSVYPMQIPFSVPIPVYCFISEFKVWPHVQIHSKWLLAAWCTADSAVMSSHFVLKSPVDWCLLLNCFPFDPNISKICPNMTQFVFIF